MSSPLTRTSFVIATPRYVPLPQGERGIRNVASAVVNRRELRPLPLWERGGAQDFSTAPMGVRGSRRTAPRQLNRNSN
jgi:hypothetical protein